MKSQNMNRVLTILKTSLSTDLSRIKKITKGDNNEEYNVAMSVTARTKTGNTNPPNKNTTTIEAERKLRNLCLFDRKDIRNQKARALQKVAIPATISKNKSKIGTNTPMIAKPTTKNNARAAAREVINE